MPNLLITNYCNRSCPYCFALAQVELGTTRPNWAISDVELETVLSYLDPRWDPVSLLGGEPSLHPKLAPMVSDIIGRGYQVKIFTNGTTAALGQLDDYPGDQLSIILNLNRPETYSPTEWQQIEKNCRRFKDKIALSFNITDDHFDWGYLVEAIEDWELKSSIRIGITQPVQGMANSFLSEEDYRGACKRMVAMAEDLAPRGISLGFDCGFRACAFTREERGILAQCGTHFLFDCRPVLDIGPDLMVWRCFPFSTQGGVHLTDYPSLTALAEYFKNRWREQLQIGNTEQCPTCRHREAGGCRGGCLSRTVNRLSLVS